MTSADIPRPGDQPEGRADMGAAVDRSEPAVESAVDQPLPKLAFPSVDGAPAERAAADQEASAETDRPDWRSDEWRAAEPELREAWRAHETRWDQAEALDPSDEPREQLEVDQPDLPRTAVEYGGPHNIDASGNRNAIPTFDGPITRHQAVQGDLGDCWLISSLGAVADRRPDVVSDVVEEKSDGGWRVSLHEVEKDRATGDWVPTGRRVHLDITQELPVKQSEPNEAAFADANTAGASWAGGLEKAFAGLDRTWDSQRHSENVKGTGYARLDKGGRPIDSVEVLAQLTGERAGLIHFDKDAASDQATEAKLRELLDENRPITVGTVPSDRQDGRLPHGLWGPHAYEVVDIDNGQVTLHNPWGMAHPTPMSIRDFMTHTTGVVRTTKPDQGVESK